MDMARIETTTTAHDLADIGAAWRVVARQVVADGMSPLVWVWTLSPPDAKRLLAERDNGQAQTITGRDAAGRVLYGRRPHALPSSPPPSRDTLDVPAPDPVAIALDLLALIADDPLLRPSHRSAARRHLARLAPRAPRAAMPAEGEDDEDEAG